MAEAVSLGARIKQARLRAAVRVGDTLTPARMAQLVAAELGRALHETQWRRYEAEESEPPLDVIRAAARVSGLSEAYIAFGIDLSSIEVHKLTPEQEERAKQAARAGRLARQQQEKRRKGPGKAG